jgi:hypothetical protein
MNLAFVPRIAPRLRPLLFAGALALAPAWALAHGKAHQHGVAQLAVALDGTTLTIELDTPLDNLVGFERAPRTAAERQRVDTALARLRAAEGLFRTYVEAGCVLASVNLESPVLGLAPTGGGATPAKVEEGHADLAGTFAFECREPAELRHIDVGLFTAFPGFKRVDAQVAGPKGQSKATLRPGAARLPVVR